MEIVNFATSLNDFPDRTCTVIFTRDCNFRCGYCYNWRLFRENCPKSMPEDVVLEAMRDRVKINNYITITGGEPTIQNDLVEFILDLKEMGFVVKLDTNGSNFEMLNECIPFVDYVAMDIKTTIAGYRALTKKVSYIDVWKSLTLLKKNVVPYEFRTVAIPSLVNNATLNNIMKMVAKSERYRILQFCPKESYKDIYRKMKPYPYATLEVIADVAMSNSIKEVFINNERYT